MTSIDIDSSGWEEQVLQSRLPVFVDFWAPWCPWCKRLMPDFDALSSEYFGRLVFAKVNADAASDIASRYGVQGLPTLKLFDGGQPTAEIIGYLPRASLKRKLDEILAAAEAS